MPVKKNNVSKSYNKLIGRITGVMTEEAVTKIAIVGQANAAQLTPIDTSNLINSQFRNIRREGDGWTATVGYTAAYAFFVHEAKGVLLGAGVSRGKGRGNVWDPGAEPQFLRKGFERDGATEIQQIIKRSYKL